ncbi:MAG: NAD(P)H-dependent oxidoreductase [Pseudomonadota bacterium]
MARVLVYYAHPGQKYSNANAAMAAEAKATEGISFVDLYAAYPRFDISTEEEQERLLEHDVILFQFPMFWYSSPALLKEWLDIVLEHGFAYGKDGTKLAGKAMMLALTAAGPAEAYTRDGYQHHEIRTFLTPFEQTARLCKMDFVAPYVLYGSLRAAASGSVAPHAEGYGRLLRALRDDRFDRTRAAEMSVLHHDTLPLLEEV